MCKQTSNLILVILSCTNSLFHFCLNYDVYEVMNDMEAVEFYKSYSFLIVTLFKGMVEQNFIRFHRGFIYLSIRRSKSKAHSCSLSAG